MEESDSCRGTCTYHHDRDALIKEIEGDISEKILPVLNQHKGYWKVFFWGGLAGIAIMIRVMLSIQADTKAMRNIVFDLKEVVSVGEVEHDYNQKRLDNHRDKIIDLETRIRDIEIAN